MIDFAQSFEESELGGPPQICVKSMQSNLKTATTSQGAKSDKRLERNAGIHEHIGKRRRNRSATTWSNLRTVSRNPPWRPPQHRKAPKTITVSNETRESTETTEKYERPAAPSRARMCVQFRRIHPGDHHSIARRQKRQTFRMKRKNPQKHRKNTSDPQRHHMVEFAYSFEESTLETTTAS